jgi:hypothetical protein
MISKPATEGEPGQHSVPRRMQACFGSLADMTAHRRAVRYTPGSGHCLRVYEYTPLAVGDISDDRLFQPSQCLHRLSNRSTLNSKSDAQRLQWGKRARNATYSSERAPSVPLGSGQRTPWTGYKLDRATREAILYAEVHMTTSP